MSWVGSARHRGGLLSCGSPNHGSAIVTVNVALTHEVSAVGPGTFVPPIRSGGMAGLKVTNDELWMAWSRAAFVFEGLSSNSAVICLISVSLFVLLGLDRSISEIYAGWIIRQTFLNWGRGFPEGGASQFTRPRPGSVRLAIFES